jgi:hypothetical protein
MVSNSVSDARSARFGVANWGVQHGFEMRYVSVEKYDKGA